MGRKQIRSGFHCLCWPVALALLFHSAQSFPGYATARAPAPAQAPSKPVSVFAPSAAPTPSASSSQSPSSEASSPDAAFEKLPSLPAEFYAATCPKAYGIVSDGVKAALAEDVGHAAELLRLHFHDCFVNGCDASVLLDGTKAVPAEKDADISKTLGGFEVVDAIKLQLEAACPGTVSCADVLALAARDSVFMTGGPWIPVGTGRRDGAQSLKAGTSALPTINMTMHSIMSSFMDKGLTVKDMIALSGAHTIGAGHCANVRTRIPPFKADPLMDAGFSQGIQGKCFNAKKQFTPDVEMDLDSASPNTFDNQYYKNLLNGKGYLMTDSLLSTDEQTATHVEGWATDQAAFFHQFTLSMIKMSEIGVLTGSQGEIRKKCGAGN